MKKILILYYSGVGNTKKVAISMHRKISENNFSECYSIENNQAINYESYDGFIIGFPVIHSEPAGLMIDFIERLPVIKTCRPVFIFATCGLYSENSLRILSKLVVRKNLQPIYFQTFRCAAIDGILLMPNIKFWYKDEPFIEKKIELSVVKYVELLHDELVQKIPRIKWYSPLNFPNKIIGKRYHFKIYIQKDYCTKCNKCINHCPVGAIDKGPEDYPFVNRIECTNCYRCIHHCPQMALSLSRRKPIKHTLFT